MAVKLLILINDKSLTDYLTDICLQMLQPHILTPPHLKNVLTSVICLSNSRQQPQPDIAHILRVKMIPRLSDLDKVSQLAPVCWTRNRVTPVKGVMAARQLGSHYAVFCTGFKSPQSSRQAGRQCSV